MKRYRIPASTGAVSFCLYVISAGSVVTKDVPSGSIVVGNPAKVIKSRKEEKYMKFQSNEEQKYPQDSLHRNFRTEDRLCVQSHPHLLI